MATKTKTSTKAKAKTRKSNSKKASTKAKLSKESLDDKNVKDTVQKVVETKRELKYDYPETMTDTLERKRFRQKVRNKIYKFERDLAKMDEGKDKKSKEKKYMAFRKEVLLVP